MILFLKIGFNLFQSLIIKFKKQPTYFLSLSEIYLYSAILSFNSSLSSINASFSSFIYLIWASSFRIITFYSLLVLSLASSIRLKISIFAILISCFTIFIFYCSFFNYFSNTEILSPILGTRSVVSSYVL